MGELAALGAAALWAIASTIFARAGRHLTVDALNLVKTAVGLVFMQVTLLLVSSRAWPEHLPLTSLAWLSISGVIGLTIGDSAYFQSLLRLGPRRSLLLWALIPSITALGAVPALGETLTWPMAGGILLTGAGVTWVLRERTAGGPERQASPVDRVGILYGLLAVLCQVGGSLTAKYGGRGLDALDLSVVRLTAGTLTLGLLVAVRGQFGALGGLVQNPGLFAQVVLATFVGTYLGIWLSMFALQATLAGIAATLTSTSPLFVLPIAHFVLKEPVSARAVVGALIAVAGVAVLVGER